MAGQQGSTLQIDCCLADDGRELNVFRTRHFDVKIIRGRAELAEGELLAFRPARVDAIFRNVDEVISDVKSYDRMIDAVV